MKFQVTIVGHGAEALEFLNDSDNSFFILFNENAPEELAEMITTETPTDTRIMSISVTDDDTERSKTDRRHTQKSSQRTDYRDHECGFCQHRRRREPSDQPVFPECQEEHDARRTARTCHLYGIRCTDLHLR